MSCGREYVYVEGVEVCHGAESDIHDLQGEGGYLFHDFYKSKMQVIIF